MRRLGLFVLFIVILGGPIFAADDVSVSDVRLMVGRSMVLDLGTPIARVSLTSADIADAMVTAPNELLINGKMPGTISMFVWDRAGGIRRFEVVVQRDLARLNEQVKALFPGEAIAAASNGKSIVLSGNVTNKAVAEKAIDVAAGYVEKKEEVVNLLQIRESTASNQVLLRVRFAEVSRTAMMEIGTQLFTGPGGYHNFLGRTTTQQQPAPTFDAQGSNTNTLTFSDFMNVFLFDMKHQLGVDIKALQTKGLFQTLAEPNLVAESGKEASFLAGGEFPVPVAQPSGGSVAITVVFKEFGIRLNFTPIVNGDRIHLKVRPEVSTLDFANGVTLQGFRIPALSTRRAETELELMNGQTFAMAGLLDNTVTNTMQKIPGIGDIPILGQLFKSHVSQKEKTELVVMITPEILPRNSPGLTTEVPRTPEQYLPALPDKKTHEAPPPAFEGTKRMGDAAPVTPVARPVATQTPLPSTDPAAAAAAMSALNPTARPVTNASAASTAVVPSKPIVPVQPQAAAPAAMQIEAVQAKPVETAAPARPLTKKEQEMFARARKEEAERDAAAQRLKAEQDKRDAKVAAQKAEEDRKKAKVDAEHQAKLAKEQAERDREQAKKQAEIDKKQQKVVDEAAAKLKAAQDAYQAELAKKTPKDR
ncbi:MAG TPA: pilus assembly protein N-terminal domain-containing protein [Vicinamibacterales bacterium]